jgi:hypothetical protein
MTHGDFINGSPHPHFITIVTIIQVKAAVSLLVSENLHQVDVSIESLVSDIDNLR